MTPTFTFSGMLCPGDMEGMHQFSIKNDYYDPMAADGSEFKAIYGHATHFMLDNPNRYTAHP